MYGGSSVVYPQHSPQCPLPILRAVHGCYTARGVLLPRVRHINAHRLRMRGVLCFADDNLEDLAVLSKVLLAA